MKKIVVLTLMLSFFAVGSALAAYSITESVGSGTNSTPVKLSKNVSLNYLPATGGLGYSVATYHSSGTRTFGSSSGDSKIYYQDLTLVDPPTAPTGTASAAFVSPWIAL